MTGKSQYRHFRLQNGRWMYAERGSGPRVAGASDGLAVALAGRAEVVDKCRKLLYPCFIGNWRYNPDWYTLVLTFNLVLGCGDMHLGRLDWNACPENVLRPRLLILIREPLQYHMSKSSENYILGELALVGSLSVGSPGFFKEENLNFRGRLYCVDNSKNTWKTAQINDYNTRNNSAFGSAGVCGTVRNNKFEFKLWSLAHSQRSA